MARLCSQPSKELDFGVGIRARTPGVKTPLEKHTHFTHSVVGWTIVFSKKHSAKNIAKLLPECRRVLVYIYIYAGASNNLLFFITFGLQKNTFLYIFVCRSRNHRMVLLFNINKAL